MRATFFRKWLLYQTPPRSGNSLVTSRTEFSSVCARGAAMPLLSTGQAVSAGPGEENDMHLISDLQMKAGIHQGSQMEGRGGCARWGLA